jgi:integrase
MGFSSWTCPGCCPAARLADAYRHTYAQRHADAYRHTYAQRHADAGVGIDVLRELMDHRKLDTTKGYYIPRELHQTGVTTVVLRGLAA